MSGLLLHSPADIVRYLLIGLGHGVNPDSSPTGSWPISAHDELDAVDATIAVLDTIGRDDGRAMIDGERFEHEGIQVRVRARTSAIAYAKAQAVAVSLDKDVRRDTVTIGATTYTVQNFSRVGNVVPLRKKELAETHRSVWVFNGLVTLWKND